MKKTMQSFAAAVLCLLMLFGTPPPAVFSSEVKAEPLFEEAEEVPVIDDGEEAPAFEEAAEEPVFEEEQEGPVIEETPEEASSGAGADEPVIVDTPASPVSGNRDFSSMRLLVKSRDPGIFRDSDVPLASLKDVYLLQFETEEETRRAYVFYLEKAEAVEVDTEITAAEEEEPFYSDLVMTTEENPFAELQDAVLQTDPDSYDIALIDTGLNDANDAVSMIGEDTGDDHGHGTLVAERIREQNPDARILSVKALDENGHGTISSVYAALEYVGTQNVKIVNLSMSAWVTEDSSMIEEAVNEAASRGIKVVGAAGNQTKNASWFIPGGIEAACIVGAARQDGSRNPISNFGETVDYYAASDSTSEAAGTMSGWLSLHRERDLAGILNQGLFFSPDYVEEKTNGELKKAAEEAGTEEENSLPPKTEEESYLAAAAERFNRVSITTKEWKDIQPNIEKWIQKNIPYKSPCSGLIDWQNETAYGLDCSGFVNAMVHLYYDDGRISYDWAGTWFASATWPVGLEAAGLKVLKNTTKQAFNNAYRKGTIKPGDIIVFSNAAYRGVHVAIVYGQNQNGEVILAHAYGSKLQKTTFNNVYDWDFPPSASSFGAAGSGTYTYYEVFRGTPPDEKEATLTVTKTTAESNSGLVVKKTLKGNAGDADRRFSFTAVYTPAGAKKAVTEEFTLKGGEEKKLSCEPGTAYKVTEASCAKEGYTTTPASGTYSGTVPKNPDKNRKFSFTIAYVKPGETKVTKETFQLAGGEKKSFSVKPNSAYAIAESAPAGKWKTAGKAKQTGTTEQAGKTTRVEFKNIYEHEAVSLSFVNQRSSGFLSLEKRSAADSVTDENRCYSLEGAKYAVYQKDASVNSEDAAREKAQPEGRGCDAGLSAYAVQNDGRAGTFFVDAKGCGMVIRKDGSGTEGTSLSLLAGEYYVVETAPAKNYELNPKVESVTVREGATVTLSEQDRPASAIGIEIEKKNANPEYARAASLSGTQFTVNYYDNMEGDISGTPVRSWVLNVKEEEAAKTDTGNEEEKNRTSVRYLAKMLPEYLDESVSDDFYFDEETKKPVIPVGTISVEETKTAPGYTKTNAELFDDRDQTIPLTDGKYIGIIRQEGEETHLEAGNFYTMFNTPVEIYTDAVYMGNESHYGTVSGPVTIQDTVTMNGTDGNNVFWKLKGKLRDITGGTVISKAETEPFLPEALNGTQKNLTFEIPDAAALEGHILYVSEELFYLDGEEEVLAACEDEMLFGAEMEEAEKEKQRIHFPKVRTELTTGAGLHETAAEKTMQLTDHISYYGLIKGRSYTVKGILMDGENGKELADDKGNEILAEQSFTAEETDGALDLLFSFPSVSLAGKKIVAFERIYENETEAAVHADLTDSAQTVNVLRTEIGTCFVNAEDSSHDLIAGKTAHLTDRVTFEHLVPGAAYELTGTVMNRETKETLTDPNGEIYTKTIPLVSKEAGGTAEMQFAIAPECFRGGGVLVAFEELCYVEPETKRKIPVAEHKDLNAENQTVQIPSVFTRLSLSDPSGAQKGSGVTELYDEVELNHLRANETYTVRGYLVNKESGAWLKQDGSETPEKENAYSGTYSFRAEGSKAVVQVPFFLETESMDSDVVCFEEVHILKTAENGRQTVEIVAEHADLNNELQTIHFSNPKTGDRASLRLWGCMIAGSALVLFFLIRIRKRKRNAQERNADGQTDKNRKG